MRKARSTYKSCSDLPLYNFIQILVYDDKNLLYNRPKKPWHKAADLDSIWDSIFMQYIEESKDDRSKAVLELMKEISFISNKLEIIQQCVNLLANVPSVDGYEKTISILKTYGFQYQFTNETIIKDLQRTVKSAKQIIIERDQLKTQLSEINKNEQERATEKDFSVHLANISSALHLTIDPKSTTVMQYIGYLEVFNAKVNERTANTRNS